MAAGTGTYALPPIRTPIAYVGTPFPNGGTSVLQNRHVRPLRSVHHVKPGETLSGIASMYGMTANELAQLNSYAIGGGGVVHPGMRLQV